MNIRQAELVQLGDTDEVHSVQCFLMNASQAPILEVEFGVTVREKPELGHMVKRYTVLSPGASTEERFVLSGSLEIPAQQDVLTDFSADVTFTDAAGIRWNRRDQNQPTRVFPIRLSPWWTRFVRNKRMRGRRTGIGGW